MNCCWCWFKRVALVLLAAALVAGVYFYERVDEELRARVQAVLAAKYPHLTVKVRSALWVKGQGIELRGVSLAMPGAVERSPLAYCDELVLHCSASLGELAEGKVQVSKAVLRRPTLRATRLADGTWSVEKLWPLPHFGPCAAEVVIENALVEVIDQQRTPPATLTLRDVELTVRPSGAAQPPLRPPLELHGSLAADHVRRMEFTGRIDAARRGWQVSGLTELQLVPELLGLLPASLTQRLAPLGGLRAEATVRFSASGDAAASESLQWSLAAQLDRGRYDDPRLPYPFTNLRADVLADQHGLTVRQLSARSGQTSLRLSGRREGYEPNSALQLEASAVRLRLDDSLSGMLPEKLRQLWYQYLPDGEVDAQLKLAFDSNVWRPELTVKCLNVAFNCYKIPYRLEQGSGTLALKDDVLTIQVAAYSGAAPIRIDGRIVSPGPGFTGFVAAKGQGVAMDEKLLAAAPQQVGQVLRGLNPRGTFDVDMRLWRDDAREPRMHQHAEFMLNRCSINYEKFQYPIGNLRGRVDMLDGHWTFRDLQGTNDTAAIHCRGELGPADGGQRLQLTLDAGTVPLEEELRDALPPGMRHLWTSLRPRGSVDLVAEVGYSTNTKKMTVDLRARTCDDSTSIEPVSFPYRMERLHGAFHYRDGRAELENIEAVHGRTSLVAKQGHCEFQPDGSWELRLEQIFVDRLRAERDLMVALPERLRRAVTELKPDGAINLRGTVVFSKAGRPDAPLRSQWDVALDLHRAEVECGAKLENIFGGVQLTGASEGERFHTRGELALDSVSYRNLRLSDVVGPFWVDNEQALIGSRAEPRVQGRALRRIRAKLYGGAVEGDCQVVFGQLPQYTMRAALSNASLAQLASENFSGQQKLQGRVLADVELRGVGKGTSMLAGSGNVRLRDADIYELPLMVSLLKILSIRPPDTTAFTKSDIRFRVQGEHVVLEQINFNGDAVSLLGQGQVNFDKQVDLTFHAMVGRDEFKVPILRGLLGEASQQLMQIRVRGTLDNPETRGEPFPAVGQVLQQFEAALQGGNAAEGSPPRGALQPQPPRR